MRSALDRLRVLGVRELLTHRGRAGAAVAVVAVSCALLVAVLTIIGSIDRSIDRVAEGIAGNAALEVSGASDSGFPDAVRDDVARVPGVRAAVPMVRATVNSPRGPLLLLGTDAQAAALDSPLRAQLQSRIGSLLSVPDGVLAGPHAGLRAGERIRLQDTDVTVAGVLDGAAATGFDGGAYVLAPLATAQRITARAHMLDSVLIVAPHGAASVRSAVNTAVGGRAVVSDSSVAQSKSGNGVMLIRFVALSAAAMAFLVAGFLIYTAMGMAVAQRRPVLSTLRSIGGARRALVGDLLLETAVLAVVGSALGAVLGVALGRIAIGRLPALFLQSVTARVEFVVPVWAIPVAIGVSVAVCVLAAALAARQVYRVSPVEALAPVGVSVADRVRPRLRIVAGVLAVVLAVAAFAETRLPGIAANAGISTMFAAEIALGFAVGPATVRAAAWTARWFGGAGTLAAETIRRSPQRVWATLMTVAVAVAATFAINAGNANAVASTRDSFGSLGSADVWVSATPAGTFPTGPLLPAELAGQLRALPGAGQVVAEQAGYVSLGSQRVLAYGMAEGSVNPLLSTLSAQVRRSVLDGAGAVISRDLAKTLKTGVGGQVSMPTATGQHSVRVAAVVPYFSALNGAIGISSATMRTWFARDGASTLAVRAAPGTDPARLLAQVQRIAPAGVHVYSGAEAVRGFAAALDQATSLDNLIWVIVIVISAVALMNTLLMSVLDRRRELGVLRAVGASRRSAVAMVLAEAAAIGIAGGVLGLIFGCVQQVVADLASSRAWNVDVHVAPVPASFALAAGALVLCLLGALPPARRVARMNIIEAIGVD